MREAQHDENILAPFKLNRSRTSNFILNSNLEKISLTGLIFGRHHNPFDYCSHFQISQKKPSGAEIPYVAGTRKISNPSAPFDDSNVKISFKSRAFEEPTKTLSW